MFLLRSLRGLSLQIPTDWKRRRGADARGAARRRLTGGGTPALQEEASVGTEGCGENRPTLAVLQQGSFTSLVLSVEDQGPSVPRGSLFVMRELFCSRATGSREGWEGKWTDYQVKNCAGHSAPVSPNPATHSGRWHRQCCFMVRKRGSERPSALGRGVETGLIAD